ncbi:unnamed protein product [Linum tenue]|uniref:Uncharacterized protein n=1 Tax=Linum tenue TaxID=586396 RepID=A0AAV0N085_9ROSI|nr:unnamed protein product [Linum tenue]
MKLLSPPHSPSTILLLLLLCFHGAVASSNSSSSSTSKIGQGYRLISIEETHDEGFLGHLQVKQKNKIYGADIPTLQLFVNSTPLAKLARVFRKPSRYAVEIKEPGTHMARFHVLVDNYVALSNFTVSDTLVKEYLVWVSQNKLVITIVPTQKGKLGFVNAIEVLSAPKDLIPDTATLVRDGEETRESYGELNYSG